MLKIVVPKRELFDESAQEFIIIEETTFEIEHSLVSVSKWESKYHKPFLSKEKKSNNEILDYIRFMTITDSIDHNIYFGLTQKNMEDINNYISDSMTATWFNDKSNTNYSRNSEQVTSELIYFWMVSLNIPFECQYWHLNRLLTLIRICNIKNSPSKKMSKKDIYSSNAMLNASRRKALGTKG